MFVRLPDVGAKDIAITIDGVPITARAGDTVAAALFAAGRLACRTTPVTGAPRGPFCMMGVCFDCLVGIDGRRNLQACLVAVTAGMRVTTHGAAAPAAGAGDGP
ncbi:MAG: (2Fe-2S)-binding protein [Casimicrobiaceae bacterium]